MPSTHATPGPAGRTAADPAHGPANQDFLGHPKGLYVCFFTEMWERFSFYGMKALLLLYVLKYHLFGDDAGYDLLGAYGGLVYAVPVIGGLVADRWLGMRKAVVFGGSLLVLGHLGMAYEGHAAKVVDGVTVRDDFALQVFYLSLALIIMGVGFLKPNISTIVGQLYPQGDPRRDSGFTLYYYGINLGAFWAAVLCGFLGQTVGWWAGFGLAGVGMALGWVVFVLGKPLLQGNGEPPNPELLKRPVFGPVNREWLIYIGGILGVAVVWFMVQRNALVGTVLGISTLLSLAAILWVIIAVCKTWAQRQRMMLALVLIFGAVVFFTLFEQAGTSLNLFADRNVDLTITPVAMQFLGITIGTPAQLAAAGITPSGFWIDATITAAQVQSFNAGFILIFAPIFAALWAWLASKKMDPNPTMKFGLGLVQVGLGFLVVVWAAGSGMVSPTFQMPLMILALLYMLHTTGELFLSLIHI